MQLATVVLAIFLLFISEVSWAQQFALPGGGQIKYKQSLRIPFTPIKVEPYSDVQVTCLISSDGKSGEPSTLVQVNGKRESVGSWGNIDGRRINNGLGEVTVGKPNTFSSAFKVIWQVDYVEFINLDKVDTITILQDSCVAETWQNFS